MEKINIELFRKEYSKIEEKLEDISYIPKLWGDGETFNGIHIEDDGIYYNTSTYYSGCGTDEYSFVVKWEELNNPIEYFEDKYRKEIEEDEIKKQKKKEEEQKSKDAKEYAIYQKLKEKFKDIKQ